MDEYDVLVLSGGGIKGIMMIGSLEYLNQLQYLSSIRTYIGTSVGAILSLLLVVGYSPKDIFVRMMTSDMFESLSNVNILGLFQDKPLCSIEGIKILLQDMVDTKLNTIPTLSELYRLTTKDFTAVSYNESLNTVEYFNYRTHPDLNCIDAVLMSASIPLVFPEFRYNNHLYIDGGLADNFPISYYDNSINKILGIYIEPETDFKINHQLINRIFGIIQIPMIHNLRTSLKNTSDNVSVIKLQLEGTHMVEFGLEHKKKFLLYNLGYRQTLPQIRVKYD